MGHERSASRVSRRDFLIATTALGGVATFQHRPPDAQAQTPAASAGVRGGILKVALATEPTSLDNHTTTDTLVAMTMWHVYETLFTYDTNFQAVPLLAHTHEVSRDGLTHAITIRKKIRFHNGEELTSTDVVASVRRWGMLSNLGKSLMAATRELVATDRYKLEFRLKEQFATLAIALARSSQGCAIYPKSVIEASGSGPRRPSWAPGPTSLWSVRPTASSASAI